MESQFRQPEYLSPDDEPIHRVRCPVHGFIHYSRKERKIVAHRLFRRLQFIKQLALTDYVYPGATHTRFEHSLGVMHIATQAFDQLAQRKGATLEEIFRKVPDLKSDTLAKARQLVRLAALLHDIGHAPFSHAAEDIIHKDSGHEELGVKIIREKDFLGELIDKTFFAACASMVARIIEKGNKLEPQLKVLKDIISGQMDADRTDYLLRDSHHSGVEYGRFDYRRMIECLNIWRGPGDTLEIALDFDGLHTFESLILARYQMHTQVYMHRIRRIYDHYLQEYFREKGNALFDSSAKILSHNDFTMFAAITADASASGSPESTWAKRIVNRHHHKEIHTTGEVKSAIKLRASRELAEKMRTEFPDVDFYWDKSEANIHALLLPNDSDEAGWVQLRVINKAGESRLLGEQSHILQYVPRDFQRGRIFADFDDSDGTLRRRLRDFAVAEYARKIGG